MIAVLAFAMVLTSCKEPSEDPPAEHVHTYSTGWTTSDTHHWHAATCEHTDEKSGYGEHSWNGGQVTIDPTMTTDGVKTYTCTVCGAQKTEPVQKLAICVSTFAEFEQAFTAIREEGETRTTICLTADIAWDTTKYAGTTSTKSVTQVHPFNPSGPEVTYTVPKEKSLAVDATGLTIDLNNHSITGVPNLAFELRGNSFTIKNGSIVGATTGTASKFPLIINYSNTATAALKAIAVASKPSSYDNDDTTGMWAKRIKVDGITITNGGCSIAYSTFEISNCSFSSTNERALNIIGSSGTLSGVTLYSAATGNSALYVQNFADVVVTGTVSAVGRVGGYFNSCSVATVASSGSLVLGVTGNGSSNKVPYIIEKQAELIVNGGLKIDTTNSTAVDEKYCLIQTSGMLTMNAGSSIVDKTDNVIAKNAAEISTGKTDKSTYDESWKNYNQVPVVTDNRVLE